MAVDMIEIETQPCMRCNKRSTVRVSRDGYEKWVAGAFIQTAFPDIDAGQRELMLTGTHSECWDAMFGDDD